MLVSRRSKLINLFMDMSSVCARVGGRSSGYCLGLSGNSVIETATPRPITKASVGVEPFSFQSRAVQQRDDRRTV